MEASLVKVEPASLKIEVKPNVRCHKSLVIHNVSDGLVMYKVKTTNSDRYAVGNNHGIIAGNSKAEVKIGTGPFQVVPDTEVKDKFLIMYKAIEERPPNVASLWKELEGQYKKGKKKMYKQEKVKCKLVLAGRSRGAIKTSKVMEAAAEKFETPSRHDTIKGTEEVQTPADTESVNEHQMVKGELHRKNQEYEELITYTVKMACENEELKKELNMFKEGKAPETDQNQIESYNKQIRELKEQLAVARSTTAATGTKVTAQIHTSKGGIRLEYYQLAILIILIAIVVQYVF